LDSDKLMREVMVRALKNYLILSPIVLACVACGVRGPLTVNPPPIKGLTANSASPTQPSQPSPPAPTDLRATPAANVLFGADGKKTIIPATAPAAVPESK
jgi:predicted small lipoprotein YifL